MRAIEYLTPSISCIAAALALALPKAEAATRTVTSCANTGAGSLRSAVASAGSGDTVVFDTVQMNCSTITLTSGQISIGVQELTIQGPADSTLTVGGFNSSRVFLDYGDHARKLTLSNLTIANGYVSVQTSGYLAIGGCIETSGELILSHVTVSGCKARGLVSGTQALGGGIFAYRLTMQDSTITNNEASGYGGAFGGGALVQDRMTIVSSRITDNTASRITNFGVGGGLNRSSVTAGNGDVLITASTISGNHADVGGGLAVVYGYSTSAKLERNTLSGNKADVYSGAIHLLSKPGYGNTTTIRNSTVSGNRSYKLVGGVYNNGYLTIDNSTILGNTAATSVFNTTYAMAAGLCTTAATLHSTIIAYNTVDPSSESDLNGVFSPTISGSGNLIMVTLAGTTPPPGTLTVAPFMAPLQDNGGPTLTHALLPSSPALGTGNNVAHLASDQRGPGFARSTAGKTDIGAFQSGDGIFYGGFD